MYRAALSQLGVSQMHCLFLHSYIAANMADIHINLFFKLQHSFMKMIKPIVDCHMCVCSYPTI